MNGTIAISGMKNAALPILFACALVSEPCVLHNVPEVSDVETSLQILKDNGIDAYVLGDIVKGEEKVVLE